MYLKEQLYVCTLAETGNITKAAEQLFISQPALSTYINNLESNLNVQLFVKKNGKYILTYLGEKYVEKAKHMLKLQDEFNLEHSLYVKGVSGRIRMGVQARRSPLIVPDIVCFFNEYYPNIEFMLEEGDIGSLEKMMDENKLDFIIYICQNRKLNMEYEHIQEDKILAAINRYSSLRSKTHWNEGDKFPWIDIKDLKDELLILPPKGQSTRGTLDFLLNEEGIKPKKILEVSNFETIIELVNRNLGVGFNRESYTMSMNNENILYLNIKQDITPSELVIAYSKDNGKIPNFLNIISSIKSLLLSKI